MYFEVFAAFFLFYQLFIEKTGCANGVSLSKQVEGVRKKGRTRLATHWGTKYFPQTCTLKTEWPSVRDMTLPRWLCDQPEQSNAAWLGAGTITERTAYLSAVNMNFQKGGFCNAEIIQTPAGRMGILPAPENRTPHLQSPLPQLRKQLQAELSGWGTGLSQVLIQTLCLLRSKK